MADEELKCHCPFGSDGDDREEKVRRLLNMIPAVNKMYRTLYGNGKPGLQEIVIEIRVRQKLILWTGAVIAVAVLGQLVITFFEAIRAAR